jgi:hypothetical protein
MQDRSRIPFFCLEIVVSTAYTEPHLHVPFWVVIGHLYGHLLKSVTFLSAKGWGRSRTAGTHTGVPLAVPVGQLRWESTAYAPSFVSA